MRRRDLDGCPVTGALQMLGDKWTLLIVRDLASGPRRTTVLLEGLFPISSRTLVGRLRDMEKDALVERIDYGGNPPRVEYSLTDRGRLLLPLLDALRVAGEALQSNQCEDRKSRVGFYCETCTLNEEFLSPKSQAEQAPAPYQPPERDDSIVLL
jgi:DNA-binding HxlR family transcriptional regulator